MTLGDWPSKHEGLGITKKGAHAKGDTGTNLGVDFEGAAGIGRSCGLCSGVRAACEGKGLRVHMPLWEPCAALGGALIACRGGDACLLE